MTGRIVRSLTSGMVLAFGLLTLLTFGSAAYAVSTAQQIRIPMLLTARGGSGADLLGLEVQAPGVLVWFFALAAALTVALVVLRRGGTAPDRS